MDRFASNTFRTLAIIGVAVFVIVGSLLVLFIGLCFRALANAGGREHYDPTGTAIFYAAIVIDAFLVTGGVVGIAAMTRSLIRSNKNKDGGAQALVAPYPLLPGTSPPKPASPHVTPPNVTTPQARAVPDVATHLSPASAATIQRLAAAIAAKIAAEVALGLVGWNGALGSPKAPFPLYQFGFMAWGLAAIAPHLVLLYALARRPGRTTFAYALVIPSIHIFFGLFGHSAFLAFVLRPGQIAAPLLSIIPWILDMLILYLAWKAIRQTGIEPDPSRLIVAAVVIFLYTSLLPALVFVLNYFHH
ncbi:MAG: hypothetical protein WBW38_02075 [Candidatus Sulfotelmatobacter sp.]